MLAVSTLGCPGMPLDRVAALLRRHGLDAVQLRCAPDEPTHVGLTRSERRALRALLDAEGLQLIGLATYVRLSEGATDFEAHRELAHDLGAPAMRLMPGDRLDPARRALEHIAPRAEGVRLNVETHDGFLRGADLARLLFPPVGAVWDALHPWRAGEPPAATAAALGPYLAELQIKDVPGAAELTPLVPGTGRLPLHDILRAAAGLGFEGPVVLEHEARWHPDAAPIGAAIKGATVVLRGFTKP